MNKTKRTVQNYYRADILVGLNNSTRSMGSVSVGTRQIFPLNPKSYCTSTRKGRRLDLTKTWCQSFLMNAGYSDSVRATGITQCFWLTFCARVTVRLCGVNHLPTLRKSSPDRAQIRISWCCLSLLCKTRRGLHIIWNSSKPLLYYDR